MVGWLDPGNGSRPVDPAPLFYYAKSAPTAGRQTLRMTSFTWPNGASADYQYLSAADLFDDDASRVTRIQVNSVTVAQYAYTGLGQVVKTEYPQPDVFWQLHGSSMGSYPDLDRFNRVTSSRWTKDLATDVDFFDVDITYDRNSNITLIEDNVHTGFDVEYTNDNLNRLTQAEEGTWGGSSITSRTRDQQWTLDQVGNWDLAKLDLDGDNNWNETDEYNDDRTHNVVNEITAIGTNTGGLPVWATPDYDDAGNMTSFVSPTDPTSNYSGIYDAWNRLVAVKDGADFVAAYEYDGLKRRVVKKSYSGGVLQETRDFYFSDQWQILSEAVSGTTDLTYAWGLRYVDELLWRVDDTPQRLYAMQDANFNCTAICDETGSVVERYQFDSYGNRTVLNASWSVIGSSAYAWVIGHQGLRLEVEVGLYNCRNRVYLPLLGCWMQRDPLGYADGANLYEYVSSNPIIGTDPEGTGWYCVARCVVEIAIATALLTLCIAAIAVCATSGGAACPLAIATCCHALPSLVNAIDYCIRCKGSKPLPAAVTNAADALQKICIILDIAVAWRLLLRLVGGGGGPRLAVQSVAPCGPARQ